MQSDTAVSYTHLDVYKRQIQKIDLEEWDFEVNLTREALVKIERGIQHIKVSQLKAIKVILETTYDELLK